MTSHLDTLYRSLLLTRFFTKGWGSPENLKKIFEFRKILSDRNKCQLLVNPNHPIHIEKSFETKECIIRNGYFISPLLDHFSNIMPHETHKAYFQIVLPKKWNSYHKPVCLHLAGTGDHGFSLRRYTLAVPLITEAGIGSILLENPYYGRRKPKDQLRSCLHNVSDLFIMGGALVLESMVLLHWCEQEGFGPLGITGISMGGHMASLAATNWHKPLSLIPCLSWSTASTVFTKGVMSGAIPWKRLQKQYLSQRELFNLLFPLIHSPESCVSYETSSTFSEFGSQQQQSLTDENKRSPLVTNHCNNLNFYSQYTSQKNSSSEEHFENSSMAVKHSLSLLTQSFHFKQFTKNSSKNLYLDSVNFMRNIMDECTHLGNFSVPFDCSLIIVIVAKIDAYYPRDNVLSLHDIWPGVEVRSINSGHICAILRHKYFFRKAIIDSLNRQFEKYY